MYHDRLKKTRKHTTTSRISSDVQHQLTSSAELDAQLPLTPSLSNVPIPVGHPDLPERVLRELPRGSIQPKLVVV